MLKINELNSYLKNKGVPEDSYSINEVNDESLCIVQENLSATEAQCFQGAATGNFIHGFIWAASYY